MENHQDKPILAICYDFDKTLSPNDMQAQGYIQSVGYEVENFWRESNKLAQQNEMDQNLAYMYMMTKKSRGKFVFNREKLRKYGAEVQLYPGVETWFDRINTYGEKRGVVIQHYIISSGLKEMIEGTKIYNKFTKVYASSFYYDDAGVAVWPAQAVNYTNKTQYLFRIEKGILDVNDERVNDFFLPDKIKIPFRNIVYIGDSDTDIPCMKLVNSNGGYSIGVYDAQSKDTSKVFKMLREDRIRYFVPADYQENSELENLLKNIINNVQTNEILMKTHFHCTRMMNSKKKQKDDNDNEKIYWINRLSDSKSFAETHRIISKLRKIKEWSNNQRNKVLRIALTNKQVTYILQDNDIHEFFTNICQHGPETDDEKEVMKKLRE